MTVFTLCRVCVQAALPKNVCLMLDCYGNRDLKVRDTMHVQGLSHWAPANIGPYSQCVKVGHKKNYFRLYNIHIVLQGTKLMITQTDFYMRAFTKDFICMHAYEYQCKQTCTQPLQIKLNMTDNIFTVF